MTLAVHFPLLDFTFLLIQQVFLAAGLAFCIGRQVTGEANPVTARRHCPRVTTEAVGAWSRPLTQSGEASWRKWCLC